MSEIKQPAIDINAAIMALSAIGVFLVVTVSCAYSFVSKILDVTSRHYIEEVRKIYGSGGEKQ